MPSNRELSDLQVGQGRPIESGTPGDTSGLTAALVTLLDKEFAVVHYTGLFTSTGDTTKAITSAGGLIYLGTYSGPGTDYTQWFKVLGTDGKEVLSTDGTVVIVSALDTTSSGFASGTVTATFNKTIPTGVQYRIAYGVRQQFASLGTADLVSPDIHGYPIGEASPRTTPKMVAHPTNSADLRSTTTATSYVWNPTYTGSALKIRFVSGTTPTNDFALSFHADYTPQQGDELIITVSQEGGDMLGQMTWPVTFSFSGTDNDVATGIASTMLFRAVYSALGGSTPKFLVTRTDY